MLVRILSRDCREEVEEAKDRPTEERRTGKDGRRMVWITMEQKRREFW